MSQNRDTEQGGFQRNRRQGGRRQNDDLGYEGKSKDKSRRNYRGEGRSLDRLL